MSQASQNIDLVVLQALRDGLPSYIHVSRHFAERFNERFPNRFDVLKAFCAQLRSKTCELIFECVVRGQTLLQFTGATAVLRFDEEQKQLQVVTIYKKR